MKAIGNTLGYVVLMVVGVILSPIIFVVLALTGFADDKRA
jgi:hypothetical protein